jgi:hypothetical protein
VKMGRLVLRDSGIRPTPPAIPTFRI